MEQFFSPSDEHQRTELHPWRRFVAIGDSFTEGVGDPNPMSPGGVRGWADRVAEVLAQNVPDFSYANLAIRGKVIREIVDEQVEPALQLKPDLVSISAGGNDLLRAGADPDHIAELFEGAVTRLRSNNATVLVFTGVDVNFSPVFRTIRGKVAIYNENIHAIAARHDCIVANQWALTELRDPRMWSEDRLHLSPLGHHSVARMVLASLNVPNALEPLIPGPIPLVSWKQARVEDLVWAREYLVPWVLRRIRHQSSGDGIPPKRPEPTPVLLPSDTESP